MLKVAFIINGSRKLNVPVKELIQKCKDHPQLDVYQFVTSKHKDAIQFARACTEKQFEALVAVGGDGTINEVLNGMMQVPFAPPLLGIITTGTGNDFAKGINLKWNLKDFIPALLEKRNRTIDVGRLNTNDFHYYFLNIADIGFGGKVVQILENQRKYFGGITFYGLAILRAFFVFRKPTLHIETEDFNYHGPVMMVAVCNGSVFGKGLVINPQALPNDGILNVTILGKIGFFHYLKNLGKLKRGEMIDHPEVTYITSNNLDIKVMIGRAHAEMDGEYIESGDINICLDESKIQLIEY